jgi:hypothetical protein
LAHHGGIGRQPLVHGILQQPDWADYTRRHRQ